MTIRHEFYESDEKVVISVFDKGADPAEVKVTFEPRKLTYEHGDKSLVLEPLRGQIDPDESDFSVGKVKVEIRLIKRAPGRWSALVNDSPDPLAAPTVQQTDPTQVPAPRPPNRKNWDGITQTILASEKEKTTEEDPNVTGDAQLNEFFQKIFADADDDAKKAMLKSFQESGGTTLSTNWEEVKRGPVEVKPPSGSEWRKWD